MAAVGNTVGMRFRLGLVVGFGAGYYLGAMAGRQRYEQINRLVRKAKRSDAYEAATEKARDAVDVATDKAKAVVDLTVERAKDTLSSDEPDTATPGPGTPTGSTERASGGVSSPSTTGAGNGSLGAYRP